MHLTVSGYDQLEEEIFEIEEVRRFYALVHETWPGWLFVAALNSDCLWAVVFAVLPNVTVIRRKGALMVQVAEADLNQFFHESLWTPRPTSTRKPASAKSGASRISNRSPPTSGSPPHNPRNPTKHLPHATPPDIRPPPRRQKTSLAS